MSIHVIIGGCSKFKNSSFFYRWVSFLNEHVGQKLQSQCNTKFPLRSCYTGDGHNLWFH